MCAAAAGPPTNPVNDSTTASESPVNVKVPLPVAVEALGGTSVAPLSVAVKIVAA
jgi:hypothetical protein